MQAHHIADRQRLCSCSQHAARAAKLLLPLLTAALFAAALLLTLHASARAVQATDVAPSATEPAIAQDENPQPVDPGAQTLAPDAGLIGADAIEADANATGRRKRDEVVGYVHSMPDQGFLGTWEIVAGPDLTITVVVDKSTRIRKFSAMPKFEEWVEVRGIQQPDGTLLARRIRPSKFESGEVVLRLRPGQDIGSVLRRHKLTLSNAMAVEATSDNIYRVVTEEDVDEDTILRDLAKDPAVGWAELNYFSEVPTASPYRTWKWGSGDDSGYVNMLALQQVNVTGLLGQYTGAGVTVAVLDTGIDASHPVFAGRLLPGWDMLSGDSVPQDGPEPGELDGVAQGHGTHISGLITRIASQSQILPVRVLDANGRGNIYVLANAIEWATNNGADVINLSLGSDFDSQMLSDAVANAQARGIVIVAAAGNESSSVPKYPANYPGVLGVTAVDELNHKADFANFGASWVDIAAPGVSITSTIPVSPPYLYAAWSGTSMATPFVSAAAALVIAKMPDASADTVSNRLISTGRNLDDDNPGYAGQIGRMLDVAAAVGSDEVCVEVPLVSGWNLLSLPVQPVNTDAAEVLAPLAGKYNMAFSYNACDAGDQWKSFDPAVPAAANDLTAIDMARGIWVDMKQPATATFCGRPAPATTAMNLCSGWNLLGFPSEVSQEPAQALASTNSCFDRVFTYDAADGADQWKNYVPGTPASTNDLSRLEPGNGYWIYAAQSCTWIVNGR